jgi:hypothetical protein
MTLLRVVTLEASRARGGERTYSRFPVRFGRAPQNDCQFGDTRVSRFHAEIDLQGGELVLRDLGSQNGTFFADGQEIRRLTRGGTARFASGRVEFVIGDVLVEAVAGARRESAMPPLVTAALREAANTTLASAERVASGDDNGPPFGGARSLLTALFGGVLSVHGALTEREISQGNESDEKRPTEPSVSALLVWIEALAVALRTLERDLEKVPRQVALVVAHADAAINALLRELEPGRVEHETTDAGSAMATWSRYRELHRGLVERHARNPSVLCGSTLADAPRLQPGRERDNPGPISGHRVVPTGSTLRTRQAEETAGEPPPSSD